MADAIPVHGKSKVKKEVPVEVTPHSPEGGFKDAKEEQAAKDALLAKAKEIVAAEVPVVPDELVNTLGQEKNYGKIQSVTEMPYDVVNRKGEPTGEVRTHLRINH